MSVIPAAIAGVTFSVLIRQLDAALESIETAIRAEPRRRRTSPGADSEAGDGQVAA